jgi:cell division protein FtsQ
MLWVTAVLVPLAALAWLLLLSPVLAVDRVQVVGNARLTPEQVVEAAAVAQGTPLARVDVGAAADRVRELAPADTVRVRRVWPATLQVTLTERTPVAGVPGPDGVLLLDVEGVGFATERELPPGVPQVEVAEPGTDDPTTRAALAVLLGLPPELAGQVAVVRASTPSDVSFSLADGRTVAWGAPADATAKTAALQALLRMPGEFYDVSAPGVAVRR